MAKNPVIHELAVIIASQQGTTRVNPKHIKTIYGNYLVAVKTMSDLDADEKFKKEPFARPTKQPSTNR